MKLALFQYRMKKGAIEANVGRVRQALAEARDAGADLLLLPEFWALGWDLTRARELADAPGQGLFAQMSALAAEYGIGLLGTHACLTEKGVTNRAVLYGPDGVLLAHYDKMHLFGFMGEDAHITAGNAPVVADTPWGRLGLAVCFDLRFPELFRRLALDGAEAVLIPAYWPAPRLDHWQLLLRARAVENQIVVAGVNRSAEPGGLVFGYSAVIGPDGRPVVEAGEDEVLLMSDIDLSDVVRARQDFPALASRRSGYYGNF